MERIHDPSGRRSDAVPARSGRSSLAMWAANIVREKLGWVVSQNLKKELGAMENIDRRTVFAAGLAAASLISNTSASAQQAAGGSAEARLRELGSSYRRSQYPSQTMCQRRGWGM